MGGPGSGRRLRVAGGGGDCFGDHIEEGLARIKNLPLDLILLFLGS